VNPEARKNGNTLLLGSNGVNRNRNGQRCE